MRPEVRRWTASSVTVPRQLRTRIETSGIDLVAELRSLLPARPAVRVQRWSTRRVVLALATVALSVLAVVLLWADLRAGGLL